MKRLQLFFAVIFLSLTASGLFSQVQANEKSDDPLFLKKEKIKELKYSVFEIVIKREKDLGLVYKKRLPIEKIPFRERHDDFDSTGTAFAISSTDLVSAAHVFDFPYFSTTDVYYVRDSDGQVHEINQVKKYSQYKDMIVFSLKTYPKQFKPMSLQTHSDVGDRVYTVGNALAQGIAIREGQLANYSPEERAGKWNQIVFSAPVSGGNSGGPLVNAAGDAIGIVVSRYEGENLNFALPASEILNTPENEAEFYVSDIGIEFLKSEPIQIWDYRAKLPMNLKDLAKTAESKLRSDVLSIWNNKVTREKSLYFPNDAEAKLYLWNQDFSTFTIPVRKAKNSKYELMFKETDFQEIKTSNTETAFYLQVDPKDVDSLQLPFKGSYRMSLIEIDFGAKKNHLSFLNRPQLLLDPLVAADPDWFVRWITEDDPVPVETLGPPTEKNLFKDTLGRPWLKFVWRTHHDLSSFFLNCLPKPSGFGCVLHTVSTRNESLAVQEKFERLYASWFPTSYSGTLDQWKKFLTFDKFLLPEKLQTMGLQFKKETKTLTILSEPFSFQENRSRYSEKTNLTLVTGYNARNPSEQAVLGLVIDDGKVIQDIIVQHTPPQKTPTSDEYEEKEWQNKITGHAPFNGQPHSENAETIARWVLVEGGPVTTKTRPKKPVNTIYLASCKKVGPSNKRELQKECEKWVRAIKIKAGS